MPTEHPLTTLHRADADLALVDVVLDSSEASGYLWRFKVEEIGPGYVELSRPDVGRIRVKLASLAKVTPLTANPNSTELDHAD